MGGSTMHRLKITAAVLATAIVLGGLSASAASARSTLVIKEEGGPALAVGASVGMAIEFPGAECVIEGSALVAINHEIKDALGSPLSVTLCSDAEITGGALKEIQLTSSGKVLIRTVTGQPLRIEPFLEGCVYEITKLAGAFKTPELSTVNGEAKGKLSKAYSTAKGCEKKLTTEFTLYLEASGELVTG